MGRLKDHFGFRFRAAEAEASVDPSPSGPMSSSTDADRVCTICPNSYYPPPIQSGCACRSDSGLAHVDCLIEKAVSQQAHRGAKVWWECQTCEQNFTGAMRTGLGDAWWSWVCDEAEESDERLCAAHNLAECRNHDGQYAEAERIGREVLDVWRRVLGEEHPGKEHPGTLKIAGNLASSLSHQGKYADAERIEREGLDVWRRVLGAEHPDTLMAAANLESSLSRQGKYADAERIEREVLAAMRRILGEEHPDTLMAASNLAASLYHQGKYAEAKAMLEATLDAPACARQRPSAYGSHCAELGERAVGYVRRAADQDRRQGCGASQ
jgi:hypothetical protein